MELKEFIEETLSQIIGGIEGARDNCPNAVIAPDKEQVGSVSGGNTYKPLLNVIDFEVILTDKDMSGNKKGIGVSFGRFGAGYKNEKGSENATSTSVRFAISIIYPPARIR